MSTTYSKETFQLVRAAENVPVKVQSMLDLSKTLAPLDLSKL
jgi:hypothetical protein